MNGSTGACRRLAVARQAAKFYCQPGTDSGTSVCRLGNTIFASGKMYVFPPANGAFPDCKFPVSRWQNKILPLGNFSPVSRAYDMHRKSDTEKDRSALRQVHYM